MIVVVIIGILAAVAIPSYQGFQNKAKGAEAKVALSAIYSAEKAYYAENSVYTAVLSTIGIPAEPSKYYLAIGFTEASGAIATTTTTNNNVVSTSTGYGDKQVNADCKVGDGTTSIIFKACAQRVVGLLTNYVPSTDWNINEAKNLKQAL